MDYIAPEAGLLPDPMFCSAIVKIQRRYVRALTDIEKFALSNFRLMTSTNSTATSSITAGGNTSLMKERLAKR